MTKSLLLLIGLFFAVSLGVAGAQQAVPDNNQGLIGTTPPLQSIRPTRSPCSASSQSVRVCNNDFQSCNSACTATTISDPGADLSGCTQRCCTNFSACLSIRGCANLASTNCFSPLSPEVRALKMGETSGLRGLKQSVAVRLAHPLMLRQALKLLQHLCVHTYNAGGTTSARRGAR